MAIIRQKTSFGPGVYRGHAFSADRLKAFVDGTNAAIAAGVPIPLLKRHAPINASDDDTKQFANEEGSGWVTKVELEPDGSIAFHADAVPEQDAKAIQSGLLKFTSPEFRPHYECEKAGVYSGPVIRHFAFTPTPGNPHQGPIEVLALSELDMCIQLSEADYQGPVTKDNTMPAKTATEQYAELSSTEAPSINGTQDSQYKSEKVKYPKHDEDAEDDEDTGIDDMANGEGKSIDEEEVVAEDEEKKKKGKKNDQDKGEEAEHEQEMDKESNKAANSQHAEKDSDNFGKPENDEPNAPPTQPPNDPNLEVMENPEAPVENPDMPPKATDKSKLAAIIAGLAQKNVVVPSDWDPCQDGAMDILLGCLNSAIAAENNAEVEASANEGGEAEQPTDAPMPFSEEDLQFDEKEYHKVLTGSGFKVHKKGIAGGGHVYKRGGVTVHVARVNGKTKGWSRHGGGEYNYGDDHSSLAKHLGSSQHTEEPELQFSEAELSAMPAKARKVIEAGQVALKAEREARIKAEQEAIAFAEQQKLTKAMAAKGKAITAVQAAVIPPALKRQLIGAYQNVQFSEEQDQAVFTGEQVAKMVAACIPPSLQFLEEQTNEGVKPAVSIMVGKDASGAPIYKQVTDAEQFFETNPSEFVITKERANEIANATVGATMTRHAGTQAFSPTVPMADRVAAENARNPNGVRNGW